MKLKLLILLIGIVAISSISGCLETGKGYSTDTIYGCELNGIVWKTWSCWLTNDHPIVGQTTASSAIYSVDLGNTALIQQLQELSNEKVKRMVKVYYRNELIVFPWDYSSETIIYKIEVLP